MTRGLQSPSSTIQRAWHRIGNRIRKAIQPVPNAYEDEAQTIGGRKTHGDKSDGLPVRPGRPRRTLNLCPAEVYSMNKTRRPQQFYSVFCLLSSALEIELDCDLHFAWASAPRIGVDHSEVRRAVSHVRRSERGSIGDVIRFEAQLEVPLFVQ